MGQQIKVFHFLCYIVDDNKVREENKDIKNILAEIFGTFLWVLVLTPLALFLQLSEEFNSGFGSHTPLILGQARVTRYYPHFQRYNYFACNLGLPFACSPIGNPAER